MKSLVSPGVAGDGLSCAWAPRQLLNSNAVTIGISLNLLLNAMIRDDSLNAVGGLVLISESKFDSLLG